MFFRRGRLSVRKTQTLLVELFDNCYQWPLRFPITNVSRDDPLRFLCSMRFIVDWIGQGVFLLNRRNPPQQSPWFGGGLRDALSKLQRYPVDLEERLTQVTVMDDPATAELNARSLLLEIIDLASVEKKRRGQEGARPLVSWLPKTADLKIASEPIEMIYSDRADLKEIARRAVRIVWRLPGARLAAVSDPVPLGYTDLTADIAISLFGLKLPDPAVRRSLIAATAGLADDITQLTRESYAADIFWLRDRSPDGNLRQVDVRYFSIDEARRLTEHPVPASQTDWELLMRLSTSEFLVDYESRGPDLLHDLQQATRRARPERLAKASADFDRAMMDLNASGDDVPRNFYAATDAILALFQLLAARNDRWILYPTSTAAWFDSLEHAPVDAHQRISAIALLPFHAKNNHNRSETLSALAQETLDD
jgi:hypothetical protein